LNRLRNILVVDDDVSILRFVRKILEKKSYSVFTAKTGKEALELSKRLIIDVGIFDMKLPDMDGTDILEKLRGNPMIKIVLTGFPTLDNAILTTNFGADSYLVKPVKPDKLIHTINEQYRIRTEKVTRQQVFIVDSLVNFINLLSDKKSSFAIEEIANTLNVSIDTVNVITSFYERMGAVKRNNGNVEANIETNIWELLMKLPSERAPLDKKFIARL
jgi:DNA-binding response OmpR family regulator